jgi:hypothetical protein
MGFGKNEIWKNGIGKTGLGKNGIRKTGLGKTGFQKNGIRKNGIPKKRDSAFKPIGPGPTKIGSSLSVLCSCNSRATSACMYAPRWWIVSDRHGHPLV